MGKLVNTQAAFLQDVATFLIWCKDQGYTVTAGEMYRTKEQADIYLKTGFSKAGDKSLHCQRLAVDFNFFKDGELLETKAKLEPIGIYWESLHPLNSWGGYFRGFFDGGHFSRGVDAPERNR